MSGQPVDNWMMIVFLTVLLLMSLLVGPSFRQFMDSIMSVFSFRKMGPELKTMVRSTVHSVALAAVSLASVSLSVGLAVCEPSERPGMNAGVVLCSFIAFVVIFTFKQLLCHLVNTKLYSRQLIQMKPVRWNALNTTMIAFFGMLLIGVNLLAIFVPLSAATVRIVALICLVLTESGLIFKVLTSLFTTRFNFLGILLYLCALEIGPAVFALVLLMVNTNIP